MRTAFHANSKRATVPERRLPERRTVAIRTIRRDSARGQEPCVDDSVDHLRGQLRFGLEYDRRWDPGSITCTGCEPLPRKVQREIHGELRRRRARDHADSHLAVGNLPCSAGVLSF